MTQTGGTVAVVLPRRAGPAQDDALAMLRAVHALPARYDMRVIGPPGAAPGAGLAYQVAARGWWQVSLRRRYAEAVAETVRRMQPTLVEVHDSLGVAALVAERLRPVPVLVVLHADPQAKMRWHSPANRTFLLAQATRVATGSAEWRARLLEGVHRAMRHCDLLPDWSTPEGARQAADTLDALRDDALRAWSRRLDATI